MLLKNKTAIITGSNRGIGKAILEKFAQNGANVFAHARKQNVDFENLINELKLKYNVEITPVYFDLSNIEEIKSGIKYINSFKKPIDILVNNAGIILYKLFLMSTVEDIQNQFDVNFKALFFLTQYVSKIMLRQGNGSIINFASRAAYGDIGNSVYGASKASVISFTKTLSEELAPKGIRVNAIAPGIIKTDMIASLSEEALEKNISQIHLRRLGDPYEVANAVLFLASDLSSYITGSVIRVDGGG